MQIADCTKYLISIHALREEGDILLPESLVMRPLFLSTPSARRATYFGLPTKVNNAIFLSTPSARRATAIPQHTA